MQIASLAYFLKKKKKKIWKNLKNISMLSAENFTHSANC